MIKKLLLCFLYVGLFFQTRATHIVGGDFTYHWISGNNFELSLTLFRDCFGAAPFDNTITIGLFDKVTDQLTDSLVMQLTTTDSLQLAGTQCSPPPDICVESGSYIATMTIPDNPNGYYLSWERCCRNHTVVNLFDPGATGMTFYMEMPDPAIHNSSPVFLNDPLPYMCEGQPFQYNFGGFDPDGDSLVYELVSPSSGNSSQSFPILPNPLPGPYSAATFQVPYTLSNLCGGTPLTVNPVTGMITAVPSLIGIYAMAELVREFRNGVQIGSIRREIEFTVIICDANTPPDVTTFSANQLPGTQNFEVYETDSICFSVNSSDPEDSLYLTYTGDCFAGSGINPPFAITANAEGFKSLSTNFCWHTGCGQGRTTPYQVDFEIRDNGCPLPTSIKYSITIKVKKVPLIKPLNLLCASFEGDDITNIYWSDTTAKDTFLLYYVIYRNVNGGGYNPLDTINDKKDGFYRDETSYDYKNNNYCYFICAVNTCSEMGVNSDTLCTDDVKNDKPTYITSVSVADKNKIQIKLEHFQDAPYYTFYLYKKENDSLLNFTLYKTFTGLTTDTIVDLNVQTNEKSYCYYIINEDPCGNVSPPSNEARSILLTGTTVPFINTIHWTEYVNWRGGVFDYEIYRKTDGFINFSRLTNVEYLVFDLDDKDMNYDHGKYSYQVRAKEGAGGNNAESFSNEVDLTQPPLVFAPNAFTPNDDNANETWGVSSIFIKDYSLRIYNRYGESIFATTNKHASWDGTIHGKTAPQGVYVYEIRYNSFYNENESRKTGTITLLK